MATDTVEVGDVQDEAVPNVVALQAIQRDVDVSRQPATLGTRSRSPTIRRRSRPHRRSDGTVRMGYVVLRESLSIRTGTSNDDVIRNIVRFGCE